MKIEIVGRNYTVSARLKSLIEKKLTRFDKFFENEAVARIVCTANGNRYKMELNLSSKGLFVRGEVESDNMYQNLDSCVAKVERQIVKHSDKFVKRRGSGKPQFEDFEFVEDEPKFDKPVITKRKVYELNPMTEEEALLQMELVGNDFFIFMHADLGRICLLYKKADGTIGLIETR